MTGPAIGLALLLVSFAAADQLPPNELGRVMILEYHKIDYPEARWTRTPENFRRDLETLYAKGYRLINLGDLLDRRIAVPAGTTPVVLTFDDSSPGQFRYLEHNGTLEEAAARAGASSPSRRGSGVSGANTNRAEIG